MYSEVCAKGLLPTISPGCASSLTFEHPIRWIGWWTDGADLSRISFSSAVLQYTHRWTLWNSIMIWARRNPPFSCLQLFHKPWMIMGAEPGCMDRITDKIQPITIQNQFFSSFFFFLYVFYFVYKLSLDRFTPKKVQGYEQWKKSSSSPKILLFFLLIAKHLNVWKQSLSQQLQWLVIYT